MNDKHLQTIAIHAGTKMPKSIVSPKVSPIFASSVWSFDHLSQIDDVYEGREQGYVYSRIANPSVTQLEQAVAALDGAQAAAAYSSGMAAIAVALMTELKQGDHVLAHPVLYGGTYTLLMTELAKFGIETTLVDFGDLAAVKNSVRKNTKILYIETICNPTMEVVDIQGAVDIANNVNAKVFVDNTFASPILCQPLKQGADVVLYSATKYHNGHSDVTAGLMVADAEFIGRAKKVGTTFGPTLSPFDSWLVLRGIKTLALRMERHASNALALAEYLAKHPKVTAVYYPGLEKASTHLIANKTLCNGYGGMLSFTVAGGIKGAQVLIDELEMVELVPSLAGVATTTSHPGKTSHRAIPLADRSKYGVNDGLVRVSVGIEHIDDIIEDFRLALDKA